MNVICQYCGKPAEWVSNELVYGKRYGKSWMIYLCRKDNAYVGCHNNTKIPKGTLANKELREWRVKAHAVVDPLWREDGYARKTVYKRLKEAFGEEIHIGESDIARCQEIIETVPLIFNLNRHEKVSVV